MTRSHIAPPTHAIAGGLVAGLLFAAGASAQTTIDGSPHDLVDGSGQSVTTTAVTSLPGGTGICVFCHTPHGADTTASVPLWNKDLPATTYTQYANLGTASLDGDQLTVGSVSLACLSCHDGTQAMDSVINVPGSGLGGSGTNTSPSSLGGGVTMAGHDGGTGLPVLGADLQDDHPIGIQYAGGGCSTGDTACTTLTDSDFTTPDTASINTNQVWWVDLGTSVDVAGSTKTVGDGTRDKHDLLLYTRNNGGTNEPFVECGSCHDPHSASTQPVNFLRVDNSNSQICLGCHVK